MMKNSAGMMWYDSNSTRRACPCLSEQSLPRFRDVRRRLLGQLDTYAHGPTRPGLARRCNCNQQGAKAVEGSGTGFAPHAVNAVDCRASRVCTAPGHRVSMHGCRYDRAGREAGANRLVAAASFGESALRAQHGVLPLAQLPWCLHRPASLRERACPA